MFLVQRMRMLATHPLPYLVWAALVVTALCSSYFTDPYVFGLTTIGLAWLTGAVAITGVVACLVSEHLRFRNCAIIVVAIAIAAASILKALATLETFEWT